MASSSNHPTHLEDQFTNTRLENNADESLLFGTETTKLDLSELDDELCLVGRFLMNRTIDFQAMQNRMASLWQPGRGVHVKELDPNLYIFQFYHEVDLERMVEGSSWTFNGVPLILERMTLGGNPRFVDSEFLRHLGGNPQFNFWV